MNYYYIHINAINLFKKEVNSSEIYIDSISEDVIVQADSFWAFDDLSIIFLKNDDLKISFQKFSNIKLGSNLSHFLSSQTRPVPKFLYKLTFNGIAGKDHIAVYNKSNLIASEIGLKLLRSEGLKKAESDLIEGTIEDYFANNRQYFWMPEPLRSKFIENFTSSD